MDDRNKKEFNRHKSKTNYLHHNNDVRLVLYNDDTNTFDFVIHTLIEYCYVECTQAEQLAVLAHYRGTVIIKQGSKKNLDIICDKLVEAGLTAEVV